MIFREYEKPDDPGETFTIDYQWMDGGWHIHIPWDQLGLDKEFLESEPPESRNGLSGMDYYLDGLAGIMLNQPTRLEAQRVSRASALKVGNSQVGEILWYIYRQVENDSQFFRPTGSQIQDSGQSAMGLSTSKNLNDRSSHDQGGIVNGYSEGYTYGEQEGYRDTPSKKRHSGPN